MQIPAESAASVPGRKSGKLRIRRAAAAGAAVAAAAAVAGGIATPAFARPAAQPAPVSVGSYQLGGARSANAVRTAAYWSHSRMASARNADVITARPGPAGTHPAPSGPAGRAAGAVPSQGLTPARAVPKAGPIGTPWNGNTHLPPATTSGKVFFTTTGNGVRENWVCSASAVNSGGKDTVFTAGHCVYGSLGGEVPGEKWHSNWEFVPDYSNGSAPYGVWTARQLWTLGNYVSNQDEGDDIGAAVMNANSAGQHLVNVVGGQGIAWNYGANQYVFDFGYPAAPPFNGLTLQECDGGEFNFSVYASSTMELTCNFTGGSSGGPWLMSFGGEFGYVNGVNDFTVNGLSGKVFSAYFGNNAAALYNVTASL
jgi:V8-like Glu-specific endopeptidase